MKSISNLFVVPKKNSEASLRIFCFPYAGGSINAFYNWAEKCPRNIELVLVNPPGRGTRIAEPAHESMESLIEEIMRHSNYITSKPFVFFGHSLGARVAFELSCKLFAKSLPLPNALIASASGAPHIQRTHSTTYNLPDNEFIRSLMELNGTPQEVIENAEMMEIIMPMLRCDFKIAETYLANEVQIPTHILVLNGQEDLDITEQQLEAWQNISKYKIQRKSIQGDHFFILHSPYKVLEVILNYLEKPLDTLKCV
ncbi:thioesterase domain-containing protein [Pseudoalteromonas sp. 2CM41L]|uniref:thioesterase II family protein n=1 Tax=Pseudoalteromonas sp. 2CM41L TaxID=2929857 RepID=UPI0020C0718E|nr:thioesterase domain-containing protein [Pseudoalteromonas sp. 2CM41L]MCK8108976.1 thioesterase domain-containing protein [Pseudoalteromonas sp. 2CM41L]